MFKGTLVALVTPFKDGKIDERRLRDLVEWHISEGTDGLVPTGTTGECATLSHEEHARVIEIVVKAARKRVPVVAHAEIHGRSSESRMPSLYIRSSIFSGSIHFCATFFPEQLGHCRQ